MVHLFRLGSLFYRKRMDIVMAFSRSLLIENILSKGNFNRSYDLCKEIEILYTNT